MTRLHLTLRRHGELFVAWELPADGPVPQMGSILSFRETDETEATEFRVTQVSFTLSRTSTFAGKIDSAFITADADA